MSLLIEYEERTAWKNEPLQGIRPANKNVVNKVDRDGGFVLFPGTTVVFRADGSCLEMMKVMQRLLYENLKDTDMLAQKLPAATFHMTLHDLICPERSVCSRTQDPSGYMEEMRESLARAGELVKEIQKDYAGRKVTMAGDRFVNMASRSIGLLMRPSTEDDYEMLLDMHRRFDPVMALPNPLTPHITLAYFKPGMIDAGRLGDAFAKMQFPPEKAPVFRFSPKSLAVQYFSDMTDYHDVPLRICFICDGGMHRSVMAAAVMNHLAAERNLPIEADARSAHSSTDGRPVPGEVLKTLQKNGISLEGARRTVRYLDEEDVPAFSLFSAITGRGINRAHLLGIQEEQLFEISSHFFNIPDPAWAVTVEAAFTEIRLRVESWLDRLGTVYPEIRV